GSGSGGAVVHESIYPTGSPESLPGGAFHHLSTPSADAASALWQTMSTTSIAVFLPKCAIRNTPSKSRHRDPRDTLFWNGEAAGRRFRPVGEKIVRFFSSLRPTLFSVVLEAS